MVDGDEAGVRGWEVEEGGGGGQRGSKTSVIKKGVCLGLTYFGPGI